MIPVTAPCSTSVSGGGGMGDALTDAIMSALGFGTPDAGLVDTFAQLGQWTDNQLAEFATSIDTHVGVLGGTVLASEVSAHDYLDALGRVGDHQIDCIAAAAYERFNALLAGLNVDQQTMDKLLQVRDSIYGEGGQVDTLGDIFSSSLSKLADSRAIGGLLLDDGHALSIMDTRLDAWDALFDTSGAANDIGDAFAAELQTTQNMLDSGRVTGLGKILSEGQRWLAQARSL